MTGVSPTVRISYDEDVNLLMRLVPGVVVDGHADHETEAILDGVFVFRRVGGGPVIGFAIEEAFAWDVFANASDGEVWGDPGVRFDVPTLDLTAASIA